MCQPCPTKIGYNILMRKIILASISPRRKFLMKKLGLKFKVAESGYREHHHKHLSPKTLVKFLALGKARKAALKYSNAIIIAADTLVEFRGMVLGKPKNRKDAKRTLLMLSGKTNYVLTSMAVIDASRNKIFSVVGKTKIVFKKLSKKIIDDYIKTGEPMDRAGAYALDASGIKFAQKVIGDMDSAIGLPVRDLRKILRKLAA